MAGLYRRLLLEITGDYWRLLELEIAGYHIQEIIGDYYLCTIHHWCPT